MMVTVIVPRQLAGWRKRQPRLQVAAADLKSTLEIVSREYQLDDGLLREDGRVQAFVRITIDGRPVGSRMPDDLARIAVAGTTVAITVALACG
jgi:hypothetical protein